ncbi:MAG: peptidoglycan-binding protein [Clostridia bacterium]
MKRLATVGIILLGLMTGALAEGAALGAGSRGDAVAEVQTRLIALDYLTGAADGIYGANTAEAVSAFQAQNGLSPSGTVDERTRAALDDPDAAPHVATLSRGSKGEKVAQLQTELIRYGFMTGAADGRYGRATEDAVKALEAHLIAQGEAIQVSGQVSPAMQEALERGISVYLTPLKMGDEGDEVARMQARLKALGYFDDDPNGIFGEYTQATLRAFQQAAGLPFNETLEQPTCDALFAQDAPVAAHPVPRALEPGDSGKLVRKMQEKLIELGFLGGVAGDQYNQAMRAALDKLAEHLAQQSGFDWAQQAGPTLSSEFQAHLMDDALPVFVSDVAQGGSGAQVMRVQRRLHSLYYLGQYGADGKAGAATADAIKRFQEINGLAQTGIADAQTQEVLFSASARHDETPYILRINIADQTVYVEEKAASGEYETVREMVCSTGTASNETPRGIFRRTGPQDRWHYFTKFDCWAQYTYIIDGDIMFHSVLYSARSEQTLRTSSVDNLGGKASHGCVRLAVDDAQWLFEHCAKGTIVIVE